MCVCASPIQLVYPSAGTFLGPRIPPRHNKSSAELSTKPGYKSPLTSAVLCCKCTQYKSADLTLSLSVGFP